MAPTDDQFNEAMAATVPAFAVVVGSRGAAVASSTLDRLCLGPTGRPETRLSERSLFGFECLVNGAVANPDVSQGRPLLVETGRALGFAVFTDNRLVGSVTKGRFLGLELAFDRDRRSVLVSLDYTSLHSMELFGGRRHPGRRYPDGIQLAVMMPAMAGLRFRRLPTAARDESRDLRPPFEQVVRQVCDLRLRSATGRAADLLKRTRSGEYAAAADGNPIALFEPARRGLGAPNVSPRKGRP